MSIMATWLLLMAVIAVFLILDIWMAWRHYRDSICFEPGLSPFLRFWVSMSRVKLPSVALVTVIVTGALFLPEYTLAIPHSLNLAELPKTLLGALAVGAAFISFVFFDLCMSWRSYRHGQEWSAAETGFFRWWLMKSAKMLCVMAGVASLTLGAGVLARQYKLHENFLPVNESVTLMNKARSYYLAGQFREATLELRTAIQRNHDDYEAYLWLARSYWRIGRLTEARDAYRMALRGEANLPSTHLELGLLALDMKESTMALTEATEAARLAPEDVEPRLLLAEIQEEAGKREEALAHCRAILGGEFPAPEQREQLVVVLLRLHAPAEALQAAGAGLVSKPHDQPLRYLQSQALIALNRLDEAEKVLRGMVADTAAPEPCLALGDLMMARGKHPEALKGYEEALKRAPDNNLAMNNVASVNAEYGFDLERSAALAARLYNRQPKNPTVADTLGWTLFLQGKTELALPLLQQGVTGMPENPVRRYHLGAALKKSGQQAAGNRELSTALQLSSTFFGAGKAKALLTGKQVKS